MDIMDLIKNTDPGILAFGAVIFLPGFIIAAAAVYFVLRSIVRSLLKPSLNKKAMREQQKEQRRINNFFAALDNCTVRNFSPLPGDAQLIHQLLAEHDRPARARRLSASEQFICYKRLEQLGEDVVPQLGRHYVHHFYATDQDRDAELKYTRIMANRGYRGWMLEYAKMLETYQTDGDSILKAIEQYRELVQTDDDPYLPMLEDEEFGPEAAWRLGQLLIERRKSDKELLEGYRMNFLAALHNHYAALQFMKDTHEGYTESKNMPLQFYSIGFVAKLRDYFKDEEHLDVKAVFNFAIEGARFAFPLSYNLASTYYRSAIDGNHYDKRREFYFNRIGAYLGCDNCLLQAGLVASAGLHNIPKDRYQGESWLRQAAQTGWPRAMAALGIHLAANGPHKEAIEWLEKAAKGGNYEAAVSLSILYAEGTDTIKADPKKAEHWKSVAEKLKAEEEE